MPHDEAKSEDTVFGLTARFRSGLNRNEVGTVWHDEVLKLVALAAGGAPGSGIGRLAHFGFVDGKDGSITKAGMAFLRRNALPILSVITAAVLREAPGD